VSEPEAKPTESAAEQDPDREPQSAVRHQRGRPRPLSLAGGILALACLWLSLVPTLLPRGPVFQGVVSGGVAAIGYGIGALLGAIVRWLLDRERTHRPMRVAWLILGAAAVVVTIPVLIWYVRWEQDLRELMGAAGLPWWSFIVWLLVTVLVFVLFLLVARALWLCARGVTSALGRLVPPRLAAVLGGALVAVLVIGLLNGVVVSGAMTSLNDTFKAVNEETEAGNAPPTAPELSGSPSSLVMWDSLGRTGRRFVASGPTPDQLAAFSGATAKQPIRAYVGLASTDGIDKEADLAVRELQRTHAFDRAVLAVGTTTGTGWINEDTADSLEYIYNGNTAIVSLQYSYLPSWISFIVDKARAQEAGRSLFDAVYAHWLTLPVNHRPKLVVFGESLGSFGAEAAFSGSQDLAIRTSGALFVGPPSSNVLWGRITRARDAGSPQWQPIYEQGATVRFASPASDLASPSTPWSTPRVVYLQHASDPIVWWSPDLLFKEPDWLKEPRGPDVLPQTRWIPVITFLQASADMAVADGVPPGHGHRYGTTVADAWVAILQPEGWSADRTTRLDKTLEAASANEVHDD
jgi:uncharacterized membrane protein